MMEFQYIYTKKRCDFGRPCNFGDDTTKLIVDIKPDEKLMENYILKYSLDQAIQCTWGMSEHEVNTYCVESENRGINHTEGAWPRDVNINDIEQLMRYRKKVEKEDAFIQSISQLGEVTENCIKQNNAIDIYEKYFPIHGNKFDEIYDAKIVNIFRDQSKPTRKVSSISWNPDGGSRIAVSYCSVNYERMDLEFPTNSFIWEIENPNAPECSLSPPSHLLCLEYNPKDQNVLMGGCHNGQMAWWDVRKGNVPVETTSLQIGHRDSVNSVLWLSSKSGTECFSGSSDGQVLWWDIRKLSEPTEELMIVLPKEHGSIINAYLGVSILEYEPTIPTKFMVGTEEGFVLSYNRKGKTASEKLSNVFKAHSSSVYALQRNSYLPKNFFTAGDWAGKIWVEEIKKSAIIWTKNQDCRIQSGCWSPSRPSVFFVTKENGTLDVWDIILQQKRPSLSIRICDESLQCIRAHESGIILGTGSSLGMTAIVELSPNLTSIDKNERIILTANLEKELRREKIIETRQREMQLKEKQRLGEKASGYIPQKIEEDTQYLENIEKQYWAAVSQD